MTTEHVLLLSAALLLLGLLVLMVTRARRERYRGIPLVDWQARAKAAERRAEKAETVVKAGLIPHLARLLRAKLLTGLLRQRKDLIVSQEEGTDRAKALEERLATAQGALQQKLNHYEAKLGKVEDRPPGRGSEVVSDAHGSGSPPAPRKSPFNRGPVRPASEAEPVEFREILARKQAQGSPAASEQSDHA